MGVLSIQFKNHGTDQEIMKGKLEEMRKECNRLMHNLKSSNRLLDEVTKEKRHAEYERDTMVKYYTSTFYLCVHLIITYFLPFY